MFSLKKNISFFLTTLSNQYHKKIDIVDHLLSVENRIPLTIKKDLIV